MRLGKSLSVTFSPDGSWLATVTERLVRILSAEDWSTRVEVKIPDPSHVRFSPGGDAFLVKATTGRISWHATDGSCSEVVRRSEGEGPAPEFAADTKIVNGSWSGALEVIDWSNPTQASVRQFEGEMIGAVHRFATGDGWLVHHSPVATTDHLPPEPCYFSRWSGEVPTGTPSLIHHGLRFIGASALDHAGEHLAIVNGAPPNQLAVLDTTTPTIHRIRTIESGGTGSELAWSADGQRLAVVEKDAVRVYDTDLVLLREFLVPYASSVAFAPDGRAIAIGSWKNGLIETIA